MEINDKLVKEISAIALIIIFGVLVFFAIQPLIFAVLWGLIFGYMFMPVHKKILHYVKNSTLSASLTLFLAVLIILIPLWFLIPMMIQQVFEIFRYTQTIDMQHLVETVFPTASTQLATQLSATANAIIGKLVTSVMNSLVNISLDVPLILVDLMVIAFVFFFSLKDSDKLKGFMKGISPLSKSKEKILVKQFKDITYSTIYGRFFVGLIQGLLAGLGFLVFGIPNTLVLTVFAIFLAVLPVLGVFLIWIPIAVYMFVQGNVAFAIVFVLYNLIIVSNIDNLLLAYIVSKRTSLSPVFALLSSVGGLFLFGVIGILLGPLIFAYFLILVDLYKNKNLLDLFSTDEPGEAKKTDSK